MKKILICTLLITSLTINIYLIFKLNTLDKNPKLITTYAPENTEKVIKFKGEDNLISLTGILKKEEIPEELMLGDYWYWIYFDEPHLLEHNASGVPVYVNEIQVFPPEADYFYNIDDFKDKKVLVHGYQTWGYAESSVFQIVAIKEL